ncbi:MAG: hypothetical protein WDO70_00875 [Alphaproteobacteria bacterium]
MAKIANPNESAENARVDAAEHKFMWALTRVPQRLNKAAGAAAGQTAAYVDGLSEVNRGFMHDIAGLPGGQMFAQYDWALKQALGAAPNQGMADFDLGMAAGAYKEYSDAVADDAAHPAFTEGPDPKPEAKAAKSLSDNNFAQLGWATQPTPAATEAAPKPAEAKPAATPALKNAAPKRKPGLGLDSPG